MFRTVIIIGVSGCGKTTIGNRLSKETGYLFFDADDFHPQENINKMKQNIALNDDDRLPWLEKLATHIKDWQASSNIILACSALKESYRKILSSQINKIEWIHLSGNFETISKRIQERENHFMKSSLLQSQFDALEIPSYAHSISVEENPEKIVQQIIKILK